MIRRLATTAFIAFVIALSSLSFGQSQTVHAGYYVSGPTYYDSNYSSYYYSRYNYQYLDRGVYHYSPYNYSSGYRSYNYYKKYNKPYYGYPNTYFDFHRKSHHANY